MSIELCFFFTYSYLFKPDFNLKHFVEYRILRFTFTNVSLLTSHIAIFEFDYFIFVHNLRNHLSTVRPPEFWGKATATENQGFTVPQTDVIELL